MSILLLLKIHQILPKYIAYNINISTSKIQFWYSNLKYNLLFYKNSAPIIFTADDVKTNIIHNSAILACQQTNKTRKKNSYNCPSSKYFIFLVFEMSLRRGKWRQVYVAVKMSFCQRQKCVYVSEKTTHSSGERALAIQKAECRAKRGRFRAQITDGNCHWRKLGLFSSSPISTYLLLVIVASHAL